MSDVLLSRKTLASAISGSLASMVALALCYPLDRVRSVAQVRDKKQSSYEIFREILKTEGVDGLYTGAKNMVFVLGCSNFVYFYFNSLLKVLYLMWVNRARTAKNLPLMHQVDIKNIVNLGIATLAGIFNVLMTTPLWVVATRLALAKKHKQKEPMIQPMRNVTDKKKTDTKNNSGEAVLHKKVHTNISPPNGFVDATVKIARNEGLSALWAGTTASLLLVSNPAIQFSAYEKLRRMAARGVSGEGNLNSFEFFILGALSKMVATVFTYPLQLSQTRRRNWSKSKEADMAKPHTTAECLAAIYEKEGIIGWFKGMDAKLLQTCLTAAFMFAFYEKFYAVSTRLIGVQTTKA